MAGEEREDRDDEQQACKSRNAGHQLAGLAREQVVVKVEDPPFGTFPLARPVGDEGPVLAVVGPCPVLKRRIVQPDFLARFSTGMRCTLVTAGFLPQSRMTFELRKS